MIIEFGKSYFYAKENKIVFPMVISEDKIVCTDRTGKTIIVFNSNDLLPTKLAPKNVVNPNYQEKKVVVPVISEPVVETPVIKEEPEIVVETPKVEIEPPVLPKKKVIVIEEDYI